MDKFKLTLMSILLCMFTWSCGSDEPGNPNEIENDSKVTIHDNGKTSTGAIFSMAEDDMFYIDYIKYKIVDSHLEIVGYDNQELKGDIRPYASVVYKGVEYKTRIIATEAFKDSEITSIIIPNSVTAIGDRAFSGCFYLSKAVLPNSIKEIGYLAFANCREMDHILLPLSITEIYGNAFIGCTKLKSIKLPEKITLLYGALFYNCTNLESIELPDNLTIIYDEAFCNCSKLQNIKLPSSIKEIRAGVFNECLSLKDIFLPEGLERFGYYSHTTISTFNSCELNTLYFPAGIKSINAYAFHKAIINNLYITNESASISGYLDNPTINIKNLHVPTGKKEAFAKIWPWSLAENIIEDYNP